MPRSSRWYLGKVFYCYTTIIYTVVGWSKHIVCALDQSIFTTIIN